MSMRSNALEPCAGKLARTVLRGGWRSDALSLPDLKSTVARQAFKLRAEKVERSFALILDIGGLRRTWLRGAGNVEKRYLIQVAAHNLGLVIRHRFGAGTPRQAAALFWLVSDECQARGLAIWTIFAPLCADQRTTPGASPVVLIYLLVFSI